MALYLSALKDLNGDLISTEKPSSVSNQKNFHDILEILLVSPV